MRLEEAHQETRMELGGDQIRHLEKFGLEYRERGILEIDRGSRS